VNIPCQSINIELSIALTLKKIFNLLVATLNQDIGAESEPVLKDEYGLSISLNTGKVIKVIDSDCFS
jgi:hypothetical protein